MRPWALLSLVVLAACREKPAPSAPADPAPTSAVAPPLPITKLERVLATESSALALAKVPAESGAVLRAFLADEDDKAIVEIDPESKTIIRTTKLNERPRDLLVLADGRLAATLPDAGVVAVFTRDASGELHEATRLTTPAEPLAMAVDASDSAKDAALHVTTGASHSLVSFSLSTRDPSEIRRLSIGREPRAVLVHGDRIYVTHAIEDFVTVVAKSGAITETPIDNLSTCGVGSHCSSARTARHAQSIARFGESGIIVPTAQVLPVPSAGGSKSALCPPLPVAFREDERDSRRRKLPVDTRNKGGGYGFGESEENGPPVTSDLEVLDAKSGEKWGAGNPPNLGAECILPRAVATDATTRSVLVACMGSSRVMRYALSPHQETRWQENPFSLDPKGKTPYPSYPNGVVPNLTAVKIDVPVGPTAIALGRESKDTFVWSQLSRKLSRIVSNKAELVIDLPRTVPIAPEWLAGRELFYANGDARISRDGRACANCHIDGADDGLAWQTPNGRRRTRLLRGELASGPYGWFGEHETLSSHVVHTLENLKGKGLPEEDVANLVAFTSRMQKPTMKSDKPAANVERGKQIFVQAECAKCHTAGGTDRQLHEVGTGGPFLTPTLASASTRRRLMHDGRFTSLDEMLKGTPNMGRGSELGEDDRRALAVYLDTL